MLFKRCFCFKSRNNCLSIEGLSEFSRSMHKSHCTILHQCNDSLLCYWRLRELLRSPFSDIMNWKTKCEIVCIFAQVCKFVLQALIHASTYKQLLNIILVLKRVKINPCWMTWTATAVQNCQLANTGRKHRKWTL